VRRVGSPDATPPICRNGRGRRVPAGRCGETVEPSEERVTAGRVSRCVMCRRGVKSLAWESFGSPTLDACESRCSRVGCVDWSRPAQSFTCASQSSRLAGLCWSEHTCTIGFWRQGSDRRATTASAGAGCSRELYSPPHARRVSGVRPGGVNQPGGRRCCLRKLGGHQGRAWDLRGARSARAR